MKKKAIKCINNIKYSRIHTYTLRKIISKKAEKVKGCNRICRTEMIDG